ncbi:MAG: pyridoxal-phosphate dependent enzyme [Gemmatimonadales bacterium]|nr:pyridoxal-phosphate dependent enzyme [Gemmatimonadales bacterium]NIN10492.1 pyridoxal-phosphate dependent enzyme [Gemmatimonadales bacterium]NIN49279.1 pyridoxal-phosphate dependent enzyme [Gemmatimonadales bacterium]NIP06743.1 pyridoxal-phosphate dependent enzyme [Gemmatimonadales bacterium]NIR02769.1 pyridoxal-phosphate dependent enzyme [Gemmatimonadales bacterium]
MRCFGSPYGQTRGLRVAQAATRAHTAPDHHGTAAAGTEPPIWDLVGETPLLPLESPRAGSVRHAILLKAEWLNPGGSVKDRPAREILRAGIAAGVLPRRRVLDASSGNTAVAYAMLGAAAGVGVTVCVPSNASPERMALLAAYGAEVIETDPLEGSDGAIRQARQMAAEFPDRFWYADQYGNPANPEAHYRTTGPEIWRDTDGQVTHLVAGVGTSGTLMGAGRFLREQKPDIRLIAVEPDAPFHGLEGLKHMATAIVPPIYDVALVDETVFMGTERADATVRALAWEAGLLVGWSTGAAVAAAQYLIQRAVPDMRHRMRVVVIAPDGGQRYLSERRRLIAEGG